MICSTCFGHFCAYHLGLTQAACLHLTSNQQQRATQEPDGLCGNEHYSRELLMMGTEVPETRRAYHKYNKTRSSIKLVLILQLSQRCTVPYTLKITSQLFSHVANCSSFFTKCLDTRVIYGFSLDISAKWFVKCAGLDHFTAYVASRNENL